MKRESECEAETESDWRTKNSGEAGSREANLRAPFEDEFE